MTLKVYTVLLGLILIFYILTVRYRRTLRKKFKKDKLRPLYGMSMFIADRIPKGLLHKNTYTESLIKKLNVQENIKKEIYMYRVNKIASCLGMFIFFLIFGMAISFSENKDNKGQIKTLDRDGQSISSYSFFAKNGDNVEKINVEVDQRQLSKDESLKLMENSRNKLVKLVLDKNKSANHIDKPLNLIREIPDTDISVTWDISDGRVLNYDGQIMSDVSQEGTIVNLTANMELNELTLSYTFAVNVFPRNYKGDIQEAVQEYINSQDSEQKKIFLPENISGEKISYYKSASKIGKYIPIVAFIMCVAVFFLKDRDLKSEVKKRNIQLQSDYPEILSKILLYSNAGLSIKSSIERIVRQYEDEKKKNSKKYNYAYEELKMATVKMKSGVSEINAINQYGERCGLHNYIKLANIIEQNIRRGTGELSFALENELNRALVERKNTALKRGSEISTKLLGPMTVMLIVALVILMVPALMSINM